MTDVRGRGNPGAGMGAGLIFLIALAGCSAPPPEAGGPASETASAAEAESATADPAEGKDGPAEGAAGAPAPAALLESSWQLAEFAASEPAPADPAITLSFEEGRVTGSTGCNQYLGDVTFPSPGAIRLGPIAATKRGCPAPILAAERRFLDALGSATRYALEEGRLALEWQREGVSGRLLFEPQAAGASSEPGAG